MAQAKRERGAPREIVRVGQPSTPITDLYYEMIRRGWASTAALLAGGYVVTNALFAVLYVLGGDCLEGVEPGSFRDAFFFSIETMSTIGYGAMAPKTTYAHAVVVVESFVGLLAVAMATGLVFAKFSRPSARVLFSNNIIWGRYDGKRVLMFRVANARGNDVVEASLRVAILLPDVSAEGHTMMRLHDLDLMRRHTPLFIMSWFVVHVVDESSPLWGRTREDLQNEDVIFIVTLIGMDGTFSQSVHARHLYHQADVLVDHHFVDVVDTLPDGRRRLDYTKFHDTRPDTEATAQG